MLTIMLKCSFGASVARPTVPSACIFGAFFAAAAARRASSAASSAAGEAGVVVPASERYVNMPAASAAPASGGSTKKGPASTAASASAVGTTGAGGLLDEHAEGTTAAAAIGRRTKRLFRMRRTLHHVDVERRPAIGLRCDPGGQLAPRAIALLAIGVDETRGVFHQRLRRIERA